MRKWLVVILIISLLVQPLVVYGQLDNDETTIDYSFKDIKGHWAEETIKYHYKKGRVNGYTDGTFKPDNDITVAEAITLFNSYLGLDKEDDRNQNQSEENKEWYDAQVARAKYYGYIEKLKSKPDDKAERIEVLTMMSLLIDYKEEKAQAQGGNFEDLEQLDESTRELVKKFSELGYINGYKDDTFKPTGTITRAEILTVLDNAVGYIVTNQEDLKNIPTGTKKITIINENITIENLETNAEIYISPGVEGNVKIKNCKINGQIMVSGGTSKQGIEIENTQVKKVIITKSKEVPRVEIKGNSSIEELKTKTEASIEISGETKVTEAKTEAKTELNLDKGTQITNLIIQGETKVHSEKGSKIEKLEVKEKAEITGEGKISKAIIESKEVKIEKKPEYVKVDEKVGEVKIGNKEISHTNDDDKPSRSSGGGSNHKSNGGDTTPTDIIAPQWSSGYPKANKTNETEIRLYTSLNEVGTVYYAVYEKNRTYRVDELIVYAQNNNNLISINKPNTVVEEVYSTGITEGKSYNVYLVAVDSNNNKQSQVKQVKAATKIIPDTKPPIGYSISIDQSKINNRNKNDLSFTFDGAEVGAKYNYSIDDTNVSTSAVTGSGTISTETDQINEIDVSGLDDGTLTLSVYLTDSSGNQGSNTIGTVEKEATPPSGYGVSIDQSGIDNTNETDLSFTFYGAEIGSTYSYSIDDTNGGTTAVTGNGTISTLTDQITSIDVSELDDDTLTLTVNLTDSSGNQGNNTTDIVTKDTTAPTGYTVSIDQSSINNGNKTALSFTFTGAEVGSTYSYSINDTSGGTSAVTGNSTISTVTDQISNIDVSGLDDDTLTLSVYLTDTSCNQGSTVTDTVVKDIVAPSGYLVNIDQAKITGSNKTSLSFIFAGAEEGSTYNYSIDDANGGTSGVTSNGTISTATDQISNIDVSGLDDGSLTLTVYLTDSSGNQGSNTTDTVEKDATPPTGYAVSIDQSAINNSNKASLSFTFTGAEVGSTYNYSIDDTNGGTSAVTGNSTISTATDQISNINVSSLDDDTLTLTVYLTDTDSNQGADATDTVEKDTVAPSGYSVYIDQSIINNSNQNALSFTFDNAEVGATYNYSIDDTNGGTFAVTGSGTISSATQQITGIDVSGLDDDTLTLTVCLTDQSGNSGSDTTDTVTKDATPPTGYSVSIDQSLINSGNDNALSFTFAGAEVRETYNYSIDDNNGATPAVTGSGAISAATEQITGIDVGGLDDDTLTLTVVLIDLSGNLGGNATDTVTKDATDPIDASGYPKVDKTTTDGFTVRAKANENGTAYYVVVANGVTAPSSSEVKAGTASGGGAALKSGSISLNANTEGTSAVTGLSSGTDYDVYVVSQDSLANIQSSPTKIDISTTSSIPSSISVAVTGSWAPYDEAGTYLKLEDNYNSTDRPRYYYKSKDGYEYYIFWSTNKWVISDLSGSFHENTDSSILPPKIGWWGTDGDSQATLSY
ncbi:S-layer homology domain-containing protein [Tepidibacter sp. Z1-5]|uniref:S-layer homology domain-containing protein n=1 Tax=Tepidibacter sp. Z1-5 TaxID=3134138 RepID=UPI0030BE0286